MDIIIRQFDSRLAYLDTWEEMKEFTRSRDETTTDEIWTLEHQAVFTQGQAGKPEHVLDTGDIPLVKTDRGGQVTYHGPGQLVVYLLCDLHRLGIGARDLVGIMETATVNTLSDFGVEAEGDEDARGVYVGGKKIASLGLRISRGKSYHGLALNVDMDLEPFSRINPCGYAGMQMTQLAELVPGVNKASVNEHLLQHLVTALGYNRVTKD